MGPPSPPTLGSTPAEPWRSSISREALGPRRAPHPPRSGAFRLSRDAPRFRARRLARGRPGVQRFGMAIRSRLHAVEHHPRQRCDLVYLAGRKDDGIAGAELPLGAPIVEEAIAFDDVVDLVGARVAVDRRRLPRLPARDADVAPRCSRQALVHVMLRRELPRGFQVDEFHAPSLSGAANSSTAPRPLSVSANTS